MANRTARLRREREAYERELSLKEALRHSKQRQRLMYSARRMLSEIEDRLCPQEQTQARTLHVLLRRKSIRKAFGNNHVFFLAVLHCLGAGMHWRELNSWRIPRSRCPNRMFESLAHHVLICYPLPKALYRAALQTSTSGEGIDFPVINWFLHVAGGDNLSRAPELPFAFTKKAAHFLDKAPEELNITQAMRWAQVRAMGGTDETANAFAETLGQPYGEFETEWTAVIRFVIRYWNLGKADQIPGLVSFVRHQRLEPLWIYVSNVAQIVEPLYPQFDIRQASEQSLMDRIKTWETYVQAVERAIQEKSFPKMGWRDCYEVLTRYGPVQIKRLQNINALLKEGALMRHCVGTYGGQCQEGHSSIWSLNMAGSRLATLELSKGKQVVQFRGKANSEPGPEAQEALEIWAKMEGLVV